MISEIIEMHFVQFTRLTRQTDSPEVKAELYLCTQDRIVLLDLVFMLLRILLSEHSLLECIANKNDLP